VGEPNLAVDGTEHTLEPKNKRQIVEEMLATGDTMLCVDTRHPEARVPDHHQGKEDLRLVLNLNFRHPIAVKPDGIEAELLFQGVPFLCWIPYESLWAVYDPQSGEGYLWPGQTPIRLRDLLGDEPAGDGHEEDVRPRVHSTGPRTAAKPEKDTQKERPRFRVIEGGKKD
jgi:stringent starvation protein B